MNNTIKTLNKGIFTNVIYYTEFANGNKYIGQTKQGLLKRNISHIRANKTHYDKVLKKHMDEAIIYPLAYGVEDIKGIDTQDLLNGLEIAEIMLRETFNDVNKKHGLNHTTGGYSFKRSEAHINKTKKEIKKYWDSTEGQKQKEKNKKTAIKYWDSAEGQKQKEKNKKTTIKYWDSAEGQKQKEKLSKERKKINIENILDCIEKYIPIKEVSKKFNTTHDTINIELRRHGFPSYQYLRNEIISEDLINSGMTINDFSTKYNILENDVKKALTQTGKKYLIKML